MTKGGKKSKKDDSSASQKSKTKKSPKLVKNDGSIASKIPRTPKPMPHAASDDIVFETFFHESGKTYCCIFANNQRHYLDSFESGQWHPFPGDWLNKGILVADDMDNHEILPVQETREDEIKDDREGTVKIPNKGEFMTYMFERKQNVHCYFDKNEGGWICLPIKWELYSKSIVTEIRKVKDVCPQWRDDIEILASLRANNYNVDNCVNNYAITSASDDAKIKPGPNQPKSIVEEAYNLQNLEKKVKHLTDRLNDLQSNVRSANDQKDFYQKKNVELEEQHQSLKASFASMKAQFESQQKIKAAEPKQEKLSSLNVEALKKVSILITNLKKNQLLIKSDLTNYRSLMSENLKNALIKAKSMSKFVGSHGDELETLRNLYRREAMQRKVLYNQLQELRGNIRVFNRIRKDAKAKTTLKVIDDDIFITLPNQTKQFQFDKVFNVNSTQEEIYTEVSPIITSCADGYNVTILAYGQTGSGKTYTMQGPPEDPGVNMRAIEELLTICNNRKNFNYTLAVTMVEIYNENVQDLLSSKVETLDLRSTGAHNVTIVGVVSMPVKTTGDIVRIMGLGASNRKVAETKMNSSSSRSHLLMTVNVMGTDKMSGITTKGQLNMVDLAGSERVSKTDASGARLTEAAFINKSLTSLGQVFTALRTNQLHIPYRNSKLTHILEPSLGGDAKACLFINISPDQSNVQESLSTLQFGSNARQVALGQAKANVQKGSPATAK